VIDAINNEFGVGLVKAKATLNIETSGKEN
jgi:hypothetical protein